MQFFWGGRTFDEMAYHEPTYFLMFLPTVLFLYQLAGRRARWLVLLGFSYIFFYLFSGKLIIYHIAAVLVTYLTGLGLLIVKKRKKNVLKQCDKEGRKILKAHYKSFERLVLTVGVVLLIGVLGYLKYFNFFVENINILFAEAGTEYSISAKQLMLPLGISFYTLQAIGYMADVYWDKMAPQKNIGKLALFLSFFPQLMEGPICAYSDTADSLAAGEGLKADNLVKGAVRILWGLFKKMVIADRLYVIVSELFGNYSEYSGMMIAVAAVAYTIQLYMEFSGCMDIVIGSGWMFGINMPENFRQPFFSKNASEFWRRWHISLGVWFKTYIFYPVSMSAMVKKWNHFSKNHTGRYISRLVASAAALLPVWLCNGLWHGASWSYIFYGVYYFVIIMLELILEPVRDGFVRLCHIDTKAAYWNALQILKTWVIIFTGELFFRAETLGKGFAMFASMFHNFNAGVLFDGALLGLGLGRADMLAVLIGCIIVGIIECIKEKGVNVLERTVSLRLPVRWAVYIVLIMLIIIFGAYGPGYQEVDLIYAGF